MVQTNQIFVILQQLQSAFYNLYLLKQPFVHLEYVHDYRGPWQFIIYICLHQLFVKE